MLVKLLTEFWNWKTLNGQLVCVLTVEQIVERHAKGSSLLKQKSAIATELANGHHWSWHADARMPIANVELLFRQLFTGNIRLKIRNCADITLLCSYYVIVQL